MSRRRFVVLATFAIVSIGSLAFPLWAQQTKSHYHGLIPIEFYYISVPIFGLIILGLVVGGCILRRCIRIETRQNAVHLSFGRYPRIKEVCLPLADCELALSVHSEPGAYFGYTSLDLRCVNGTGRLSLVNVRWKSQAQALFELLQPFFKDRARDETNCQTQLGRDALARVPRSVMRTGLHLGQNDIQYRNDRAILAFTGLEFIAVHVVTLLGVGLLIYGVSAISSRSLYDIPAAALGFGAILSGAGIYVLRKQTSIDRKDGVILRGLPREGQFFSGCVPAHAIRAVQLCSVQHDGDYIGMGFHEADYVSIQINLVVATPRGGRVHILADKNCNRAVGTAQTLAAFLGVPVLNHCEASHFENGVIPAAESAESSEAQS